MQDCGTSYRMRMERNDKILRDMAEKLKEKGCKVLGANTGLMNFIHVEKDDKSIGLEFGEVPYRWILYVSVPKAKDSGSSISVDVENGTELTWTAQHIVDEMSTNYRKGTHRYLKEI